MNRQLLVTSLLAATAVAQGIPTPDLLRIHRPWPPNVTGTDSDMVVGAFVADHPGRCAVVVRDGKLVLSFQPAHFAHFHVSAITDVVAVATMPAMDAAPDILVAATTAGLRVLRYGDDGFEDTQPGGVTYPQWIGATDVEAELYPASPNRFVLAHAPGWVKVSCLDGVDSLLPPVTFPVPPGEEVLDAVLLDWQSGGGPEVAVLMTYGTFVLDIAGNILASDLRTNTAGTLLAQRSSTDPRIVQVTDEGADWRVMTFVNDPQLGLQSFDGGVIQLGSAPTGLAEFDLEGDSYSDVVLSTGESVRRILPGTAQGISALPGGRIDIFDVRPNQLPPSPPPNLVPLVIDDIDRDGTQDFVIAQQPTDQLIIIRRVRSQVAYEVHGLTDEGGEVETIEFEASLGAEQSPNFASTPAGWSSPLSGVDMAGLRLRLPEEIAGQEIEVVVYEIAGGFTPEPSDTADVAAWARYRFPLNGADPGDLIDIQIPVPDADSLFPYMLMPRGLFEISMVEISTGQPATGTAPLLLEYAVQDSLTTAEFEAALSPDSLLIWYFDAVGFDRDDWLAHETPISIADPDNRYFGAIVVVKSQSAQSDPPKMPPPLVMDNGVAH